VMAMPEVVEGYAKIGWEPSKLASKEYADKMSAEGKMYADMAQRIGLKPQ
jgi:tripartite-type tricarboxylate transporter receptor subunit TctC